MELGEQIATLREEKTLTQVELAEKAKISPSTLSQIESGIVPRPHVGTVRKIARALGVEPAELRERRGLTLRELSRMSGVSPDTINQIELGHRKPRPSTLRKLARALEVDIEDFFSESEELRVCPQEEDAVEARDTIIHELKAEIGRLEYIVDRMRDTERMIAEYEWRKAIGEAK